mmetsp:Transcript_4585/g.11528  ORF Transcript_4585/g.11528 Transcript_4585/m.11528 type:complete len:134 (-) Transcript_4585:103-504(-)
MWQSRLLKLTSMLRAALRLVMDKFTIERTALEKTVTNFKHAFGMLIQVLTALIEHATADRTSKSETNTKKVMAPSPWMVLPLFMLRWPSYPPISRPTRLISRPRRLSSLRSRPTCAPSMIPSAAISACEKHRA